MEKTLNPVSDTDGYLTHARLSDREVARRHYAFPEERKFPLTDKDKVLSAIKFFNYVDPKDEKHLAKSILKRMDELGISDVNVGPSNRFSKYYRKTPDDHLEHHGVKGMHWGVWNDETRAKRMGYSSGKSARASKSKPLLDDRQKNMLKTGAKAFAVASGVATAAVLAKQYSDIGSVVLAERAKSVLKMGYDDRLKKSSAKLVDAMKNGADNETIESLKRDIFRDVGDSKKVRKFIDDTQRGFMAATATGAVLATNLATSAALRKTIEAGGGLDFYKKKSKKRRKI